LTITNHSYFDSYLLFLFSCVKKFIFILFLFFGFPSVFVEEVGVEEVEETEEVEVEVVADVETEAELDIT